MTGLVLAFIGDDEPGLVHALAEVLSDHGGNWGASHMARLGDLFAGTLQVSVDPDRADALLEDFRALDGMLQVTVRATADTPATDSSPTVTLDLVGEDRPGIVERVAAAVARPRVNVRRFASWGREAPGGRTFHVSADLDVFGDIDLQGLETELLSLAGDMRIDLCLGRGDRDAPAAGDEVAPSPAAWPRSTS